MAFFFFFFIREGRNLYFTYISSRVIVSVDFQQVHLFFQTVKECEVNTDSDVTIAVACVYSQRNQQQVVKPPVHRRLQINRKRSKSKGTVWANDFYVMIYVQYKIVTECFTLRNPLSLEDFGFYTILIFFCSYFHFSLTGKRVHQSSFDEILQLKL